jgi:hypothetical protein
MSEKGTEPDIELRCVNVAEVPIAGVAADGARPKLVVHVWPNCPTLAAYRTNRDGLVNAASKVYSRP